MAEDYLKLAHEAIDGALASEGSQRHFLIDEALRLHRLAEAAGVAVAPSADEPSGAGAACLGAPSA